MDWFGIKPLMDRSLGCIRVVRYTADAMGFQPTVTYEGDCANKSGGNVAEERQDNPAAGGVASLRIPRNLETKTTEILDDALIPADDPVETSTEIPVDDDPATDGDAVADLPGVVMDVVPVILPPSSQQNLPVLDAQLKAVPEDLSGPDRTSRCWYPSSPITPPVVIEQIPDAEKIPTTTEIPVTIANAELADEAENDAIITETATGIQPPFMKSIRRPDLHFPSLIYGNPPSVGLLYAANVRTYVIRTPPKGSLFRQHPVLVPYKIKEVWQPSQQQGPPPSGKLIRPVSFHH